jgi:hypothetical protein
VYACGVVHVLQVPESSWHWKLEPPSLEKREKLAAVEEVVPDGPEEIEVWGGVVSGVASTVQVRLAGEASVLPAASVALAEKVCEPEARELKEVGEAQSPHGRESSEHSKLELVSFELK